MGQCPMVNIGSWWYIFCFFYVWMAIFFFSDACTISLSNFRKPIAVFDNPTYYLVHETTTRAFHLSIYIRTSIFFAYKCCDKHGPEKCSPMWNQDIVLHIEIHAQYSLSDFRKPIVVIENPTYCSMHKMNVRAFHPLCLDPNKQCDKHGPDKCGHMR